jgi:hypothetical protein
MPQTRSPAQAAEDSGTFDVHALYTALDTERCLRQMSWKEVAREVGGVSPSTLTGMRTRGSVEGDGVLQMLRWLGRTPESFMPVYQAAAGENSLPQAGPSQTLRFDTKAIYAALDARRLERKMTWQQVANEIGEINASNLTRLAHGGRVSFPNVLRIFGWLGRPAASFIWVSDW